MSNCVLVENLIFAEKAHLMRQMNFENQDQRRVLRVLNCGVPSRFWASHKQIMQYAQNKV